MYGNCLFIYGEIVWTWRCPEFNVLFRLPVSPHCHEWFLVLLSWPCSHRLSPTLLPVSCRKSESFDWSSHNPVTASRQCACCSVAGGVSDGLSPLLPSCPHLKYVLYAVLILGISGILVNLFYLLCIYLSLFASFIYVNVLCTKTFLRETQHIHLLASDRDSITWPHRHYQSPTWWPNEFYWGYLKEFRWGVTCRSRSDSKMVSLLKPTPAW